MRTRHSILETASIQSVIGVVFRPGGAQAFFDSAADEFFAIKVIEQLKHPGVTVVDATGKFLILGCGFASGSCDGSGL